MAKRKAKNGKQTGEVGPGKPPVGHQFKKGNPGGPGRPITKPLTTELKRLLAKDDNKGIRALILKGFAKAKAGDFRFWKEIMDRVDGKVLEEMALTAKAEDPLSPEDMELFYEFKSKQAKGEA